MYIYKRITKYEYISLNSVKYLKFVITNYLSLRMSFVSMSEGVYDSRFLVYSGNFMYKTFAILISIKTHYLSTLSVLP